MRKDLILTAVGTDRPGIVDQISGLIFREGCNLEDSRMAILGGSFALIVLVTGSEESISRLKDSLPDIEKKLELSIHLRFGRMEDTSPGEIAKAIPYRITAVAMDHPGIVHKITNILAKHNVNVATLETRITDAPTTGTPVFSLVIEANVPTDVSVSKLRTILESAANEENLDLGFHAIS